MSETDFVVKTIAEFDSQPEEYRTAVKKIIQSHAVNELYGAQVFDEPAIQLAPNAYAKWLTCRVAMEEYGHHVRFKELGKEIGIAESAMSPEEKKPLSIFEFDLSNWAEFVVIKMFADLAEILQVEDLWNCTFHPLRNLARMTMPEERFHVDFGHEFAAELVKTEEGKVALQKAVDEYFSFLSAYQRQDWPQRLSNPVWHLHNGSLPAHDVPVSFNLLLNLVSASNAENSSVLWGFISRYAPETTPENHPKLDELVGYAIRYFNDFVLPGKAFRAPDDVERDALTALDAALGALPPEADGEAIQNAALDVARAIERYQDHKRKSPTGGPGVSVAFFQMIYQVLLGQERGPRFGSFAALYGIDNMRALIAKALAGELAA